MQGFLRLLQLLSMVVWAGGLIFFAFVLAPTAFHTLPTVHLAGGIVGACLRVFDIVALVCGGIFLAVTALMFRTPAGSPLPVAGAPVHAYASAPAPISHGPNALQVLRDELFAVETDRLEGRLTEAQYTELKSAYDIVLRRALSRT